MQVCRRSHSSWLRRGAHRSLILVLSKGQTKVNGSYQYALHLIRGQSNSLLQNNSCSRDAKPFNMSVAVGLIHGSIASIELVISCKTTLVAISVERSGSVGLDAAPFE